MKEADPEFYREASSLQYGKVWFLFRKSGFSQPIWFTLKASNQWFPALLPCRHLSAQKTRSKRWLRNSRTGRRSARHIAGEGNSMKRRTLTPSMTVTNILTRRSNERLVNIHWRLKTISREELPCLTKVCTLFVALCLKLHVLIVHSRVKQWHVPPWFFCTYFGVWCEIDLMWHISSVCKSCFWLMFWIIPEPLNDFTMPFYS